MSKLEEKFLERFRKEGLPEPQREYVFHQPENEEKQRKWRFDFSWVFFKETGLIENHTTGDVYRDHLYLKIAFEIEGATWARGRHTRGSGYAKDCEKYNTATLQGWQVYRFTGAMVEDALRILRQLMEQHNVTAEDLWRSNGT